RRHTRCLSDWSSDVCSSDLWEEYFELLSVKDAHSRRNCRHENGNRSVGLLRLRLHEKAGRKTPNSRYVISQHVAFAEKQFLDHLYSLVLVTLSGAIRHSGFVISRVLFHFEQEVKGKHIYAS